MQPIHVKRYDKSMHKAGWAGTVSPEDNSWLLFVDVDNVPHLFLKVFVDVDEADPSKGQMPGYVNAEHVAGSRGFPNMCCGQTQEPDMSLLDEEPASEEIL